MKIPLDWWIFDNNLNVLFSFRVIYIYRNFEKNQKKNRKNILNYEWYEAVPTQETITLTEISTRLQHLLSVEGSQIYMTVDTTLFFYEKKKSPKFTKELSSGTNKKKADQHHFEARIKVCKFFSIFLEQWKCESSIQKRVQKTFY